MRLTRIKFAAHLPRGPDGIGCERRLRAINFRRAPFVARARAIERKIYVMAPGLLSEGVCLRWRALLRRRVVGAGHDVDIGIDELLVFLHAHGQRGVLAASGVGILRHFAEQGATTPQQARETKTSAFLVFRERRRGTATSTPRSRCPRTTARSPAPLFPEHRSRVRNSRPSTRRNPCGSCLGRPLPDWSRP